MLFMIDDSASMPLHQASLIANFPILMSTLRAFPGGLPNLHVAVVTSDLGAGRDRSRHCMPGGKGGAFRAPPASATCLGPTGSFIDESNNEAVKNYPGTIDEAFACIANVGTSGCGFEHQIASAATALGFRGTIPASKRRVPASGRVPGGRIHHQRGRLFRPARYAPVRHRQRHHPGEPLRPSRLLPLQRVRTPVRRRHAAAHGAGRDVGDAGRLPVERGGPALPGRHAGQLLQVAEARSGDAVRVRDRRAGDTLHRRFPHAHGRAARSAASSRIPARARTAPSPIPPCAWRSSPRSSAATAASAASATIRTRPRSPSSARRSAAPSPRTVSTPRWRTRIPATAGIQASCDVVLRAPSRPDQTIPACDAATPQGGPQPCWYLTSSTACGSGVLFAVNRTGATVAGETISIKCGTCRLTRVHCRRRIRP